MLIVTGILTHKIILLMSPDSAAFGGAAAEARLAPSPVNTLSASRLPSMNLQKQQYFP